ncbi:MAG: hypothetical protein ACT4N5_04930 [Nitrosopumilaceae archaeon]
MHYDYLKTILKQVLECYEKLKEVRDRPGDLDVIKKELDKIQGIVKVLTRKIEKSGNYSDSYSELLKASESFLRDHNFHTEIEKLSLLYSEDSFRIRNMRLSIIYALEESKLIPKSIELLKVL